MDLKNRYKPEIRFADIDAMGHVNNAVYLSYFEQARIHIFNSLLGEKWDWNENGILVARNELDYYSPLLLHDHAQISVFCERIGNKSFSLVYDIEVIQDGVLQRLATTGRSVLVAFNHRLGKSIAIPEAWKAPLESISAIHRPQRS